MIFEPGLRMNRNSLWVYIFDFYEETDRFMNILVNSEVCCYVWDRAWIIIVGIEKITITCRSFTITCDFKKLFNFQTKWIKRYQSMWVFERSLPTNLHDMSWVRCFEIKQDKEWKIVPNAKKTNKTDTKQFLSEFMFAISSINKNAMKWLQFVWEVIYQKISFESNRIGNFTAKQPNLIIFYNSKRKQIKY